jgi:hypothetical protein
MREEILKERYGEIYRHYAPLKTASIIARYLADRKGPTYQTFTDYMTMQQVQSVVVNHRLRQITTGVMGLLANRTPRKRRY